MKLYVWNDISPRFGLACVLAHSEWEARVLMKKKDPVAYKCFKEQNPVEVDSPAAFICWTGNKRDGEVRK